MAQDTQRFDLDSYLVRFNRPDGGWTPGTYTLLHQLDKQQVLDLISALESFIEPPPTVPKFKVGDPVFVTYGNYTAPVVGEVLSARVNALSDHPVYSVQTATPGNLLSFVYEDQLALLVPQP